MRLTDTEVKAIRDAAHKYFGDDAAVWLFGSRVDDTRRGGDIDLYIETDHLTGSNILARKLKFLASLYVLLGEQKIDVLVKLRETPECLPIHHVARETGIRL